MTNYIPILFIIVLIVGAVYKVLTNKDNSSTVLTNKDNSLTNNVKTSNENKEVKTRVINDHIAEIMNIKKK